MHVVNERTDYGEGYSFTRFGFCVGDRIFMVGAEGYGADPEQAKKDREFCDTLVQRWNDYEKIRSSLVKLERENWSNMAKWLKIMGWNLTPNQPECATLVDSALQASGVYLNALMEIAAEASPEIAEIAEKAMRGEL